MTPAYQITANGADLTAILKTRLLSLMLDDQVGQNSDSLELWIDDRDGAVAIPSFGADLAVGIGYLESGIIFKGHFRVDEIEVEGPERKMLIRARTADTNASGVLPRLKAKTSKTWRLADGTPMMIKDIGGKIAGKQLLGFACDPNIGEKLPVSDLQTSLSDIDFLTREVNALGGQVKVTNQLIAVFVQASGKTALSGLPMTIINVAPSDCMTWRCLMTRRSSHNQVTGVYYRQDGQEGRVVVGDDSEDENSNYELPERYQNLEDATNAAEAKGAVLATGADSVSLSMVGNAKIGAEVQLNLVGFKEGVDRLWSVARAQHRIDEHGYITEVEAVHQ